MNDTFFRLIKLKAQGFCCAQMLIILALEAQDKTDTDLVRSMGGLCFGLGGNGEVCGALSGGACLLSLYAGKGDGEETPHRLYSLMMDELVGWFREAAGSEYGGTRCSEILERFPDRSICGKIVADTYEKCMDILAGRGFDPAADTHG